MYPELGKYAWITYKEFYERSVNFGAGLINIGMKPKDRLALFDDTKLEWTLASRACSTQNLAIFTVYSNLGVDSLIYALNQGTVSHIVTNGSLLLTLVEVKKQVPSLTNIVYTGDASEKDLKACKEIGLTCHTFAEVEDIGKENPVELSRPTPDDIACIMYTSGSTGVPKGVVCTHANLVGAAAGMNPIISFKKEDCFLHFLPLAHVFAYVIESVLLYNGASLGYGNHRTLVDAGVRNCLGDIGELKPSLFVGVPVIYEKITHAILGTVKKSSPIAQFIFNTAFRIKRNVYRQGSSASFIEVMLAKFFDLLVFKKIKSRIGGNMRIMVSGSAPLNPKIQEFMAVCFDVRFIQGYGLTETCSSGTAQSDEDNTVGTIGCPFPSMEVKLVDAPEFGYSTADKPYPRGEVWLKGPPVSSSYYKNPELTKEAFTDGWFATGDIGVRYPDGRFAIIDRKKNLIKPLHGEYIALEKLESAYRNCPYIQTICVYVDASHSECIAMIYPNKERLTEWAQSQGLKSAEDFGALCKDEKAVRFILSELRKTGNSSNLKSIEMIRAVRLYPDEWTPQNEMLTAAMKLNRNVIVKKLKSDIEDMYKELGHTE